MTINFTFREVNEAFEDLVGAFRAAEITDLPDSRIIRESSRNGDVLTFAEPVSITYLEPWNRAMFNTVRDCNPFFHLFEALWMLSGSNQLAPLTHFNSNMVNYSDDGKTLNGAYGYRWRHMGQYKIATSIDSTSQTGYDQLEILIDHLTMYPDSRRAVLQMWTVEDDLLKIDNNFDQYSKDVCCNTCAFFRIVNRNGVDYLDMTVINRSNDLIWGTLGANYVHFSFLQEYMAGRLGIVMGTYTQFTNNLHTYLDKFEGEKWLEYYNTEKHQEQVDYLIDHNLLNDLEVPNHTFVTMFEDVDTKEDQELLDKLMREIVESVVKYQPQKWIDSYFDIDDEDGFPFYNDLIIPAITAFQYHKLRDYQASLFHCSHIDHPHWRWVCKEWIQKRRDNWLVKSESGKEQ